MHCRGPALATANHDGLCWFHLGRAPSLQTRMAATDAMENGLLRRALKAKSPVSLARPALKVPQQSTFAQSTSTAMRSAI